MSQSHKPLLYLNLLRILGALAVVAIHSSAPLLYGMDQTSALNWWNTNILNSFSRWAVPVFIMVSGSLLLEKNHGQTFVQFLKKRFNKIAIPFIFWFVFYYIWMVRADGYTVQMLLQSKTFLKALFFEPPHIHLYFLYIISVLYLLLPFFKQLTHLLDRKRTASLLLLLAIFTLTWQTRHFTLFLWIPFVFYFLFGKLRAALKHRVPSRHWFFLYILASSFIMCATAILFANGSKYPTFFYDYHSPLVLLQAVAVFMLFYQLEFFFQEKLATKETYVHYFSDLTFGVYLISPFIQDCLWLLFGADVEGYRYTAGIINTHLLLSIGLSFFSVALMKKIPIVKKIV